VADLILTQPPSSYLRDESPEAADAFRGMRDALLAAGPLDRITCELIVIGGMAANGWEYSFKHHSRQLLDMGADMAALKHAVLVSLGAVGGMFPIARALQWLRDLEVERA
jgi:alkylhydroperoxidase/carboxymuconolactone decarboxylase family protein YurZ